MANRLAARLAILDDHQGVAREMAPWEDLAGRAETTFFRGPFPSAEASVAALQGFDAVVAMRERTAFPRAVLERLPDLELLVTTGMANAAIDMDAARDLGITVCGTSGSPAAAPELAWALLMAAARDIPAQQEALRAGHWQTSVGSELAGRTLGILGLGKIGTRIAGYAQAFGMEVIAWSQNLDAEGAAEAGARLVTKRDLFAQADIVTVHLRLSGRTRGLVGEAELRLLGPEGLLVNTARGPIVDTDALVRGLTEGWLGGAALDVFDAEPLPAGHPLLEAPRTVLTPHLGYVTREQYRIFYGQALEDVTAWLDGTPVRVLNA
ncbi:2-hydroxyacid dehydrogenase [Zafaria cholistanensis]|uniref:2-hydroxyacid dehydrogenase n=1 Tax=Zafaria cholistanensis TaxID=1682741 RepID=A0A5A7NPL5_9MICC|nr:D-2-hydroxyacid dehydrogenase family protein [Zafaria cholistanensis]GER22740.1 2-hydroxyacid dehydrogenase [Zafaria cholistanensis]